MKLIKLRNPWGMGEWKGDWSDGDFLWEDYPEIAQALGHTDENDGTFWMAFCDFADVFNSVYVCRLFDTKVWTSIRTEGSWTEETAGGTLTSPSWKKNDQFNLELKQQTNLVIILNQPDMRWRVHRGPEWNQYPKPIGFVILKHTDYPNKQLTLNKQILAGRSRTFVAAREVSTEISLPSGRYVIVPSTFTPDVLGTFTLSVFGDQAFTLEGGRVVQWSGAPTVDDLEGIPEIPLQEPEQEINEVDDPEAKALGELQKLVASLVVQVNELKERRDALLAKLG